MNNQLKLKNLSEFKDFCQKNILKDLQIAEAVRKQVLFYLTIASLIFLFSVNILNQVVFNELKSSSLLVVKIVVLPIYLNLFLVLFVFWLLFYNSIFESFCNFEQQINNKIFKFINTHEQLYSANSSFNKNIDETLNYIQQSHIFDGIFQLNGIKQYGHVYGYINNICINITAVDIQSRFYIHWSKYLDIYKDISPPKRIELIWFLFNIILFFMPMLLLFIFKLIKVFKYVLIRVIRGKNISYWGLQSEILKSQTHYNIFKGLLFRAEFNKFAKVVTVIQPNTLTASINHANMQLIKLEDPEFCKYFTVYSKDQVDARYILSTSLMEKLVDFRQKVRKNFYVSFVEDMIYIALEYPDGLFEPNLYRSMLSFAPLREYFEAIQLMLGLVEELNLDREIWKSDDV